MDSAFRFTHAITREPGVSVTQGLRAVDTGVPDLALMRQHHADYITTLRATGANVVVLPPLVAFPDALFVEDTALCLPEGAIIMRPGAPSRLGEVTDMIPVLQGFYDDVQQITGPGTIEGGDILVTGHEILVGRSARTDAAGIAEMTAIATGWGHRVREVVTPPGVLHFKTDCSLMDGETILCTARLAASGCFDGYRIMLVAAGEEAAANAIRFNDMVLFPAGFPRTRDSVIAAGFQVAEIGNAECAKLDGGMSCLSLRLTPQRSGTV
jgi:dimethylargininase